jgi:hypothetical protein
MNLETFIGVDVSKGWLTGARLQRVLPNRLGMCCQNNGTNSAFIAARRRSQAFSVVANAASALVMEFGFCIDLIAHVADARLVWRSAFHKSAAQVVDFIPTGHELSVLLSHI